MVHFPGTEYRTHTSCMSEAQKYQGALYRDKKNKGQHNQSNKSNQSGDDTNPNAMVQAAYVEDAAEDRDSWRNDNNHRSVPNPPPKAPTPPPALETAQAQGDVNVFDFLVTNPTPTASHVSLPATARAQASEDTQLVRFDPEANGVAETPGNPDAMIEYGTGPVPGKFETPVPKAARRKEKDGDKDGTKDKKRKRIHAETDHVMTDAPPVLHTGLTGGLNRLMARPTVFPPSPDYSGGDGAETPASPLKKSKSKHHKSNRAGDSLGNSLMAMIAPGSKPKSSPKKSTKAKSSAAPSKEKKKKKRGTESLEAPKEPKLLEFKPVSKDGKDEGGAMIVYKPPAEHFLSFVTKGPESTRGCSVNKALKRYHRERNASGTSVGKLVEEKELWKSLRMRRNERGEIVLFTLDS
ncbi:hypothetical protein VTH06DRAFT_777 [Thermothelomyces fergusii]